MARQPLAVAILAAGQGTRMKSARAKVLHEICGRPMLGFPLAEARTALFDQQTQANGMRRVSLIVVNAYCHLGTEDEQQHRDGGKRELAASRKPSPWRVPAPCLRL